MNIGSKAGIGVVLFCIFSFVLSGNVWAEKAKQKDDCGCNNNEPLKPEDKLVDSEKIFSDIEKGGEKINVIISLKKPAKLENVMNWRSKSDISTLKNQVKNNQSKVLKSLSNKEFKLGRQFKYQAAFSAEITPDCLNKLLDNSDVIAIEPVRILQAHLKQGIPLLQADTYRSNYNGQGVSIAICDTGIDYHHPMLGNGGFPNAKVIGGYDFGNNDSDPMPVGQAHGTCCAGIAAGNLGSLGDYIGGVAYGAKLYAVKISADESGSASSDDMIAAWEWCVEHQYDDPENPIMVISTSFGGDRFLATCNSASPAMTTAANAAIAAGITVVASSGNEGYCDAMGWPACISSVISVGAVYDSDIGEYPGSGYVGCISNYSCVGFTTGCPCDEKCYVDASTDADQVTSYSNSASFLTFFAPSNKAYTTDIKGTGGYSTGDYYSSFGGTSAACPYVAGCIASLQSASVAIQDRFLTPAEVKEILAENGDDVTDVKAQAITKPRVNLKKAIDAIIAANPCIAPEIGTGTDGWTFPIHTYYHDSRTQVIYLASEIGTAGYINSLALDVNVVPSQPLRNWTIRMKHTTRNSYSTCALDASGWTVVYQANEPAGTTGWKTFNFTTPFEYNGTSNLMVDFSYDNTSYTANGYCRYSTPGGNRSVIAYSDSLYGSPLNWSGTTSPATGCSNRVPNIMINICTMAAPNPPEMIEIDDANGACNTAKWHSVTDANQYFAQCAADSYFASIVDDSNWVDENTNQYQFCGLATHRYFYRVKARNDLNIESGWSNIVSARQCNPAMPILGDLDGDCDVDFADLEKFSNYWLSQVQTGNFNHDGHVDFLDFAIFAEHWMEKVD